MKVRCIDYLGSTKLEVGKIYEGELKFSKWWGQDRWYIKGMEKLCFREHAFEIVKEDNMEKTFREVIADIKEGEVWESVQDCFQLSEITCFEGRIRFSLKNVFVDIVDGNNNVDTGAGGGQTFKLKRKEYTFEEAFKAYEKGKEIESCVSGAKFTAIDSEHFQVILDGSQSIKDTFEVKEICGMWYINN